MELIPVLTSWGSMWRDLRHQRIAITGSYFDPISYKITIKIMTLNNCHLNTGYLILKIVQQYYDSGFSCRKQFILASVSGKLLIAEYSRLAEGRKGQNKQVLGFTFYKHLPVLYHKSWVTRRIAAFSVIKITVVGWGAGQQTMDCKQKLA